MDIFKVLTVLIVINVVCCMNENVTSETDFVPTNEWQVVKPGQKLPPGLHIRSDFQTGVTEAKVMDTNELNNKNTAVSFSNSMNMEPNDSVQPYSPEQIKRMLKGIKDESPNNNTGVEINGTKFRSYEELKKDFEKMQMSIKTDLEIIRELLDELKNNIDSGRARVILTDLEYYLHQIDNAQNFVDMGGLEFLNRFIDSNETELQSEALRCLASAVQGNSKVKVEAMKNGTLSRLLLLLKSLASSSETGIINQIFVAVSAITRQFPMAQLAFVNGGGLQISGDIFDRVAVTGDEKIIIRLVTLIADWMKERNMTELRTSSSEKDKEVIAEREIQYQKIDLHGALIKSGWCQRFTYVWTTKKGRSVDYLEKLISSVSNIYPFFPTHFDHDQIRAFLLDAHQTLSGMADQDNDDFYFQDMLKLVSETITMIGLNQQRSEL